MFQLTAEEYVALRSQIATSKTMSSRRGGRRYLPYVFTEHGAIQAASVLNSPRAVETHDDAIAAMLSAIRQLMNPPPPTRRAIGFTADIHEKS